MRFKLPSEFYKDVADLRSGYGLKEYHRDEIRPAVEVLIDKHLKDAKRDAAAIMKSHLADSILDGMERQDDQAANGELFPHDAHVALGDKKRIRRGRMTVEHMERRKRVIDQNKIAQDRAWANETAWLMRGLKALDGHSPNTVLEEVIDERGAIKTAADRAAAE
jgi:hypothetical protein